MAAAVSCQRCGIAIAGDARFCSACGAPVELQTQIERRIVTIVFADLSGFTALSESLDPEQVKHIIDRTFARLTLVVERYGGIVDKVIGDELMAVFGAPSAHEDDPERAVRCAFALRAELDVVTSDRSMPALRMHVGINTGEVVAGLVGGRDYTVLGDAVNTARRIQEAASAGQILVGAPTRDASASAISYRELGAIDAKGKRLPVEVFEALSERGLPGRSRILETPLTGRREEMHLIALTALIAERDRQPMAITIVGEAGMGKSKIASEVTAEAARRGVTVVAGRSLPYATVSPGFALEQVVRGALDLRAQDPAGQEAEVRAALAALDLATDQDTILAFLGITESQRDQKTGGAPGAGATPTLARVVDAVVRLLSRIAQRHGLLIIVANDLQWAEDLVLEALDALLREQDAPILLLALARPEILGAEPALLRRAGSIVLRLAPLSPERADEVLTALAPDLPPTVRADIIARAGGNPFFLEELARFAREAVDATPGAIPVTIHALLAARLDALPAEDRRVLQAAALAGDPFTANVLTALTGGDPSPQLGHLVELGFVEQTRGGFRFRQKLVREVAIASLPKQARVEQLARLGAHLEALAGKTATTGLAPGSSFEERIASAYEDAALVAAEIGVHDPEVVERARHYLARAGDRARARDASRQAANWYERAVRIAPADADHRLRTRYAEALIGVLRFDEAEAELRQALTQAREAGDRAGEGRVLRLSGDAARMQGRFDESRTALEEAIGIARATGSVEDLIEAERARGMLDLFAGDWRGATQSFEAALERARTVGDRRSEAWTLQNLGWTALMRGRLEDAVSRFEEGEAIFAELDDAEGRGWCMGMRAWALLIRGELGASEALIAELDHLLTVEFPGEDANLVMARRVMTVLRAYLAVARADLIGAEEISARILEEPDWHGQAWAHALAGYPLALAALHQMRLEAAASAIERGSQAARTGGDPFYRALYRVAAAWLAVERGDAPAARHELDASARDPQVRDAWDRSTMMSWLRARILLLDGDREAAITLLAESPGNEGLTLLPQGWNDATRAELLLDAGRIEEASDAAARAIAAADEHVGLEIIAREAATKVALAKGDLEEAEAEVRRALALLAEARWPLAEARTHALLAQVLDARRQHDRADEAFENATTRFDALPADTEPKVRDVLRA